ncbi:formaldehyde:ferredoxin oxidoreductase Wor5 [Trichinella spiralis]|uniref:formaldehyde:ferredoxin oxidoreductase Wor5 n=1 Tax=Trichinella spiralis TaxID=6334 RepID=UPI0001EFB315|nr:formaldehyde:ferredoxin oxidoreductase Wor5 [Trichinella spiralis]
MHVDQLYGNFARNNLKCLISCEENDKISYENIAITSSQQSFPQKLSSEFNLENAYDAYEYNPKLSFVDMLGEKMNNFDNSYGLSKRFLVGKRKNHWVLWSELTEDWRRTKSHRAIGMMSINQSPYI